jgi:hypothetical protein
MAALAAAQRTAATREPDSAGITLMTVVADALTAIVP